METISYEDFAKIDLRSGTITKAERVPKSKKLLQLEVYFGELGHRTILAGIGESYDPATIIGIRVTAVLNLAPRKMMGLESHGMLLAAVQTNGKLALVACVSDYVFLKDTSVTDGTKIG